MAVEYFVDKGSVVRQIWGRSDTILFIFAGSSAEFALNKAVDWLYFTGRLPADPLGRLFSTVSYARAIVFSEKQAAISAINSMAAIHAQVEANRGHRIPDWAYRDVLFMLIDYSIRSYEVLEHPLSAEEKQEVFRVFYRIGSNMGLKELPDTFEQWETERQVNLSKNLQYSYYTSDLFSQYRKHLGTVRYKILQEVQILVTPERVRTMLGLHDATLLSSLLLLYKLSRIIKADALLRALILPSKYKKEIKALDS